MMGGMKLFIGNKAYSSWSLRGWLAVKHSGLAFEEVTVPLYDNDWAQRRQDNEFAPSGGKVPILWDGDDVVIWDSLAIIEHLNDLTENQRGYWPSDKGARAMARSMAAEMHSSFAAIRREHSMNIRRIYPEFPPSAEAQAELHRLFEIWAQARARYGGDGAFLFGAWSAADMMFAPVVTRLIAYNLPMPRFAQAYTIAVVEHPHMQDWIAGAQAEDWVIEQYEDVLPSA
jgi:glutathione S-transferase